jgi:hypothetical protein
VEHERLFPRRQTYARYLHVAEAVADDDAQTAWDGLGGRLKALRREVEQGQANVEANAEAVEAKVEEVKANAEANAEAVEAKMEEVKADVAEVKADVLEVKALLEQLVAQSQQNVA